MQKVYLAYVCSTAYELFGDGKLLDVFDSEEKARQMIENLSPKPTYNDEENIWKYERAYDTLTYWIEEWGVRQDFSFLFYIFRTQVTLKHVIFVSEKFPGGKFG